MLVLTGTRIVFETSGFAARVVSFDWGDIQRASIDSTTFQDSAKKFKPQKLSSGGVLSLETHFNPDDPPPLEGSIERITITFNDNSTWSALMFVQSFEFLGERESLVIGGFELKIVGEVSTTEAVSLVPVINDESVIVVSDDGDTVYTPF